jgi:hypothetical protein
MGLGRCGGGGGLRALTWRIHPWDFVVRFRVLPEGGGVRDLFQVEVVEAAEEEREGDALGWKLGLVWLWSGVFSSGSVSFRSGSGEVTPRWSETQTSPMGLALLSESGTGSSAWTHHGLLFFLCKEGNYNNFGRKFDWSQFIFACEIIF